LSARPRLAWGTGDARFSHLEGFECGISDKRASDRRIARRQASLVGEAEQLREVWWPHPGIAPLEQEHGAVMV
jgi:hypothetical protein